MQRDDPAGPMTGSASPATRTARRVIIAAFLLTGIAGTMAQDLPPQSDEDHGVADPPGLTVGEFLERVAKLDRAVKELEADEAISPARRAERQRSLAAGYRDLHQSGQAVPLLEKVRTHHIASSGREHPETHQTMTRLAIAYRTAGRDAEAIALEKQALALKRKHTPHDVKAIIESLENLATCYEKTGRKDEAVKLLAELKALKAKQ